MRTTVKAILLNNQNQVLLLNDKNNHYDLPGGGVEQNETLEEALLRELREETPYGHFKIIEKLTNQYPYYLKNNPDFKSLMYCYVVKLIDETKVSELEVDTFEEWIDVDSILDFFGNRDTSRHQAMKNSIRDFHGWYVDLHRMKLNPEPFEKILLGQKDIELRLFDEKRKKIRVGSIIEFTNNQTKERVYCSVVGLIQKQRFSEIFYGDIPAERAGFDKEDNVDEMMDKYYLSKDISEYGVVGIILNKL